MTVTVIIPVFNAERGIRDCLASVLAQTHKEIEVLCVDDGSTDASPDILAEHAARDRRVRVIRQENAGAGVARNTALDAARGDAVVFMDPDDYYPSCDVLERLSAALSRSGCAMAAGMMRRVPEDDPRAVKFNAGFARTKAFPHLGTVTLDEYQSPFRYTCYIYRRSFLDVRGIRFPTWRRFQDPPFLARCLIAARRFFAIDDCVYCYRLPEVGRSVDWAADGYSRLREFLHGFNELLGIAERGGCDRMYRDAAAAFARAHRFDAISPQHPLWDDVVAVIRRMRRTGWLGVDDFRRIAFFMYGDQWTHQGLLVFARLFGVGWGTRIRLSGLKQRLRAAFHP